MSCNEDNSCNEAHQVSPWQMNSRGPANRPENLTMIVLFRGQSRITHDNPTVMSSAERTLKMVFLCKDPFVTATASDGAPVLLQCAEGLIRRWRPRMNAP